MKLLYNELPCNGPCGLCSSPRQTALNSCVCSIVMLSLGGTVAELYAVKVSKTRTRGTIIRYPKTCWHYYDMAKITVVFIYNVAEVQSVKHTHKQTTLTAFDLGLSRWAGTRKVKAIWILLKQETVNGSGTGWAICKSAPRSRQITMPALHHSVFYRPDALPAAQPTAYKH